MKNTPPPEPSAPRAKAYSYVRMSTAEQLKGNSLQRQLEARDKFVNERNLESGERYDDIGVSAFHGHHAEFGALSRFRAEVVDKKVAQGSYLLIESMDRLSRQMAHIAIGILTEIISGGVTVVTLDDGMEYSKASLQRNPYELFIAIGAMTRAHDESHRKSGMLSHVWKEKRKKLEADRTPMTSRVPAWLKLNKGAATIEPIPERVAIVREIFDLACNGYGTYSIAKILNESVQAPWGSSKRNAVRSKPSKANALWRDSYIKKILSNRAVLGEFQPHRLELTDNMKHVRVPVGEPVRDYYPQIISEAVFRDAALATERRRVGGKGRKGPTYANIFTGLLHCGQCGSGMRYLDKGPTPKGGKYLRCSVAVSGGTCIKKSYRYETIEAAILSMLESLDVQKVLGGASAHRLLAEKKTQREIARLEVESGENKIRRLNRILQEDENAPPASTLSLLRELERGVEERRSELRALDDEIAAILFIDPARREAILQDLMKRIRDDSDVERRTKARRALADELHRIIEALSILPDTKFAHEIVDADPSWMKRYRTGTQSRLERYLDQYGFELSVRYRGGQQHIIRGIDRNHLRLKCSSRFDELKLFARHGLTRASPTDQQ